MEYFSCVTIHFENSYIFENHHFSKFLLNDFEMSKHFTYSVIKQSYMVTESGLCYSLLEQA